MDKQDKKLELLKNQAKVLMGSFDSVQIITSRYDTVSGNTETYAWGEGNFHTRMGMMASWVRDHEGPLMDLEDEI